MFVSFFGLFTVVSDVQFAFVLFSVNQINAAGNVDDGLGGVQLNCLVNSGLEALEVNDSPCLGELLNLLVRQFEVGRAAEPFDSTVRGREAPLPEESGIRRQPDLRRSSG